MQSCEAGEICRSESHPHPGYHILSQLNFAVRETSRNVSSVKQLVLILDATLKIPISPWTPGIYVAQVSILFPQQHVYDHALFGPHTSVVDPLGD